METARARKTGGGWTCVIVDDHEAIVSSLSALLHDEGHRVVGVAGSGAEAVRLLDECRPQFAVLDLRLPDGTGVDVAREVARLGVATVLVLNTSGCGPEVVDDSLAAGIRGIVLKHVPATGLLAAIEAVMAGEVYLDPAFAAPAAHAGV